MPVDTVIVPAGRSGNVFTGKPDISRQNSGHQTLINCVLFNKTVVLRRQTYHASDNFRYAAVDCYVIYSARRIFLSVRTGGAGRDIFSAPAAPATVIAASTTTSCGK